jgi:hypothetical protein
MSLLKDNLPLEYPEFLLKEIIRIKPSLDLLISLINRILLLFLFLYKRKYLKKLIL